MELKNSSYQIWSDYNDGKFTLNEGLKLVRKIEYMARISHASEEVKLIW